MAQRVSLASLRNYTCEFELGLLLHVQHLSRTSPVFPVSSHNHGHMDNKLAFVLDLLPLNFGAQT